MYVINFFRSLDVVSDPSGKKAWISIMNDNEQKIVFRMINIKLKDNISNFPFSISLLIFPSPNLSFFNILTT